MSYQLTLYFIPSPFGMNWSSPASLLKSAVVNKVSLQKRFMGHVYVELRSPNHFLLTGMSSKKMNALPLLLKEGKGFGVLFHSFDGHLEQTEELKPEIDFLTQKGKVSFVTYNLHPTNFERLLQYAHEFKEKGGHLYYGLYNRPLHLEGSGCSAFGASFIQIANLLNDEKVRAWTNQVRIPLEYAGSPLTDKKVSLLSILKSAHRWAEPHEEHVTMDYWCPDQMHRWVQNKVKPNSNPSGDYEVTQKGLSQGIVFDRTHVLGSSEPFFNQEKNPLFYKSIGR